MTAGNQEMSEMRAPEKKGKLAIQYHTVPVEDIVRHFVRGYRDGIPEHFEWYYDAQKGVVILKLFIRDEGTPK